MERNKFRRTGPGRIQQTRYNRMVRSSSVVVWMIISAIFATALVAAETEENGGSERSEIFVGAGAVVRSKPYDGVDSKIYPVPLFGYEGKRLYLRGITGGYRLVQIKGLSIGPTVRPRFDGYQASDSSALAGMKNRNATVDGGVALAWKTSKGLFGLTAVTDLLGAHDGYAIEFSYTAKFTRADFDFIPGFGLTWRNSNLVDYYYGVKNSEAREGTRPAYSPDAALTPLVRLAIQRNIMKRWGLLFAVQYEWLDSEMRDSPIVDDDSILSLVRGLTY